VPAEDGVNILIADEPRQLAEAVSSLLGSPDLRERLGGAGRRLFEADFTWDAAWSKLHLEDLGN
jgi:glycosyltransferase involved in cell wall biosynthesis